ncbi:hypothetical protein OS493_005514 [Desmophyllum pertusum]|uniref:Uncharacterized protein n=1 Tax=Desmophyllum pertusum TaxID=174260 RepID=A0A9W9YSD4_9CNID|nr:hypothetical protein OS493_005514 [Desmophyllum pertusum]
MFVVKSVGKISILAVHTQSLFKKSPQPIESVGKTHASQTTRLEDGAYVFLKDRESKNHSDVSPLRTNRTHESPYKKFKTSHGLAGKRAEEIAVEEAFRDLPPDAFDEDFDSVDEDDFDLLLTAEQLDECDRIASLKLQTQCTNPVEVTSNLPPRNEQFSVNSKNHSSPLHVAPEQGSSDDDNDDVKCTQEYAPNTSFSSLSGTAGFPVISSRELLRTPIVTHPQESAEYVQPSRRGDSLLHSFVDQCINVPVSLPSSQQQQQQHVGGNSVGKIPSRDSNSHTSNSSMAGHPEDGRMQNLRKEVERLQSEFATTTSRVKTLEEEKFCKDGELKILRNSLEHYCAEEKRRQGEVKALDEQKAREQSLHEKELEKQVENLTTQIRFKEREISQMIEQNKKRTASLTEGSSNSPKSKTVINLSEVFPTGNSFFQKKSPEVKAKSPRSKQSSKDLKTQNRQNSQRLSEGENSENSTLSGTSSGLSSLERMKAQRRDTDTSEREIVQLSAQSFPEVELVQNLLSPQEKELQLLYDPENRALNEGSIISLLTLDRPFANSHHATQKTTLNETDVLQTLQLFDTQATQKDPSISCDNTLVMQTLSGLLNHRQVDNDSVGEKKA